MSPLLFCRNNIFSAATFLHVAFFSYLCIMNKRLTFKELKERVGIDDVAYSLGYRLNRQAGVGRYFELVLMADNGVLADKIVVKNTPSKQDQTYFNKESGAKGDVIDFIKAHLNSFGPAGSNEWGVVYGVLTRFANMPEDGEIKKWQELKKNAQQGHVFDVSLYETCGLTAELIRFLNGRGLTRRYTATVCQSCGCC